MKIQSQPRAFVSLQRLPKQGGFTVVQVLITLALAAVITSLALMAVGSARASMRLTASTRELAGYLEKARSNAIRRNDESKVTILSANSYRVKMDFDGDGTAEERDITLQDGVTFADGMIGISATFDWRGRVGSNILFELRNESANPSRINLSGSGDVTIGSDIFEDSSIGDVTLNSDVPSGVANTSGTPSDGTGQPSPTPTPTPNPEATPTPTPNPEATPTPTPNPEATPTPTPNPGATPTPTPTTPTPTPTPVPCTLSAPDTLTLPRNSSPKVFSVVTVTNTNHTVLTATRSGDITAVTPASTTVSGNGTISYTATYANGTARSGTVTISSSCGSKTINITIN